MNKSDVHVNTFRKGDLYDKREKSDQLVCCLKSVLSVCASNLSILRNMFIDHPRLVTALTLLQS